jgi:lysophospholipase L1-like esterase
MKAQNRAARDIPNTVTVHHGKLPLVDAVHFNHEGQVTLGKMTADAVEAFPKKSKSVIPKELSQ